MKNFNDYTKQSAELEEATGIEAMLRKYLPGYGKRQALQRNAANWDAIEGLSLVKAPEEEKLRKKSERHHKAAKKYSDILHNKRMATEETKEPTGDLKDACWKGYTAVGMKMKNGRKVPNCVPVKEDAEQLDEVSKVSSFIRKVRQRGIRHAVDPKGAAFTRAVDTADAIHQHKNLDVTDIERKKKLAKRVGKMLDVAGNIHARGKVKEEAELDEGKGYTIDKDDHEAFTKSEIRKIKNSHFPDMARENLKVSKKSKERQSFLKKIGGKSGGDSNSGSPVGSSSNNMYGEEAEQIDEVSKKTLNRYVSKARDSEQTHRAYSYRYHGYGGEGHTPDHEEDEKDERKAEKREAGIALARSKINKKGTAKVRATEEFEQIDEISTGKKMAVAYRAGKRYIAARNMDASLRRSGAHSLANADVTDKKKIINTIRRSGTLGKLASIAGAIKKTYGEEFEQIDEISKDLASRYMRQIERQPGLDKDHPEKRNPKKFGSQKIGYERAFNKVSPYGKHRVKVQATEEYVAEETPAWQRKEGKNPEGGLNQKGVESYRRENPGSKLQTAVTTEPSKLKKGSKSAKRRLSFCRRMKGMKEKLTSAETARDPDSRINKSLRKWNC